MSLHNKRIKSGLWKHFKNYGLGGVLNEVEAMSSRLFSGYSGFIVGFRFYVQLLSGPSLPDFSTYKRGKLALSIRYSVIIGILLTIEASANKKEVKHLIIQTKSLYFAICLKNVGSKFKITQNV